MDLPKNNIGQKIYKLEWFWSITYPYFIHKSLFSEQKIK